MEDKTEKRAAFNAWLMEYETPSLMELVINGADIVAGESTDEGPDDNSTGQNEIGTY